MVEGQTGFLRGQWKQEGLFAIIARLTLGAVFIYASIDKIIHPAAFAKAIYNYQILPDSFINLTAIVLPWLELVLGLFLIIALFREGSACIVTVLMLVFFGAMIFNRAQILSSPKKLCKIHFLRDKTALVVYCILQKLKC